MSSQIGIQGNNMDKGLIDSIIKEIKQLEVGTMVYVFTLSVVCFLIDFFFLRHHLLHTWMVDTYRSVYFITAFFSNIFLFDKLYKNFIKFRAKTKTEKEQEEIYNNELNSTFRLVEPIIHSLPYAQLEILKKFIEENALEIAFKNNLNGYSNIPMLANIINANLFTYGLNIILSSNFTYTFLKINEFYFDVLDKYFKKNNINII